MLKELLAHPLTRGLDLDDPETTTLRRRIIQEKHFLHALYREWYAELMAAIPVADNCPGAVLELGSGGGFFKEMLPECLCSDVFFCPGNDLVLDARKLPFREASLRAIVMVDVFHHIPDVSAFLREAQRVLRPGGVIAMWEPWNTLWSRFVYQKLHHEPFEPEAEEWAFPARGPLSSANGALPWMVFARDTVRLHRDFPLLRLESLRPDFPFSYLAWGGVSMRALAPGISYRPLRGMERALGPLLNACAMFAHIVVRRIGGADNATHEGQRGCGSSC